MSDEDSVADEPEPEGALEPGPKPSAGDRVRAAVATLKRPRILAVLVALGLVWLGVWTYSSGSSATGAVGSVSTLSAPPTTAPRAQRGGRHKSKKQKANVPTTIPAPPPGLAKTPTAFATALFNDWIQRDRTDAIRVASADAVKQLFARHSRHRDQWIAKGCVSAASGANCTWTTVDRTLVLTVHDATASAPIRVVAARVTP